MEQSRIGRIEVTITSREADLHLEYPSEHSVSFHTPQTALEEGLLGPEEAEALERVRCALQEAVCPLLTSKFGWYQARLEECERMISMPFVQNVVYADEPGFSFDKYGG